MRSIQLWLESKINPRVDSKNKPKRSHFAARRNGFFVCLGGRKGQARSALLALKRIFIPKGDSFWTFGEGHRRPACVRRWITWFGWMGFVLLSQSPHGRDGHAPFFRDAKSNFKETLVLDRIYRIYRRIKGCWRLH